MRLLLLLLLGGAPALAGENLDYSINWPTGLSLGEAHLKSQQITGGAWEFDASFDASLPGFALVDRYRANASSDFCTTLLNKNAQHGARRTDEKTVIEGQTAIRTTQAGGKSEIPVGACAKDALTFIYFLRHELAGGRVPPAQAVLFGSQYQISLTYSGNVSVKYSEQQDKADRLTVRARGPGSDFTFEVFFLRDAARTPALVRIPTALGTFTMELVR